MAALSNSYLDIILMCIRIRTLLGSQGRSITRAFQPLLPSINVELETALIRFRMHRKIVVKEAETAHIIEEANARALVKENQKAKRRHKLLANLSVLDYEGKHRKVRRDRHMNTGTWLLTSSQYEAWLNSQKSSLFCCYGIPGCGKSVLVSNVVDQLSITTESTSIVVAYYYCDYADKRTLDPINILGTLARSLLQNIEIPNNVEDLIMKSYCDGARVAEVEEVHRILHESMSAYAEVVLIIDGLDETMEHDQSLVHRSLQSLLKDFSGILRVLVSCREDVSSLIATNSLTTTDSILSYKVEIRATTISDDIVGYVSHSIDSLLSMKDIVLRNQGLRNEIIDSLVEGAKGM